MSFCFLFSPEKITAREPSTDYSSAAAEVVVALVVDEGRSRVLLVFASCIEYSWDDIITGEYEERENFFHHISSCCVCVPHIVITQHVIVTPALSLL